MLPLMLHQVPTQPHACAAPARTHHGMPGTQALCSGPRSVCPPPQASLQAESSRSSTGHPPPVQSAWLDLPAATAHPPSHSLWTWCGEGVAYLQSHMQMQDPWPGYGAMLPAVPRAGRVPAAAEVSWHRSCRSGKLRSLPAGTVLTPGSSSSPDRWESWLQIAAWQILHAHHFQYESAQGQAFQPAASGADRSLQTPLTPAGSPHQPLPSYSK